MPLLHTRARVCASSHARARLWCTGRPPLTQKDAHTRTHTYRRAMRGLDGSSEHAVLGRARASFQNPAKAYENRRAPGSGGGAVAAAKASMSSGKRGQQASSQGVRAGACVAVARAGTLVRTAVLLMCASRPAASSQGACACVRRCMLPSAKGGRGRSKQDAVCCAGLVLWNGQRHRAGTSRGLGWLP